MVPSRQAFVDGCLFCELNRYHQSREGYMRWCDEVISLCHYLPYVGSTYLMHLIDAHPLEAKHALAYEVCLQCAGVFRSEAWKHPNRFAIESRVMREGIFPVLIERGHYLEERNRW